MLTYSTIETPIQQHWAEQQTMRLFVIVGAQKSGTTWLQRSLNSVDGVHCLGEGHFIDRLVAPIADTIRHHNNIMGLVAERLYEGEGFYPPIPDAEFSSVA